MPTVLLVGEWEGDTASVLSARGYAMRRADAGEGVARHVDTTNCALVRAGDGDAAAVEALAEAAPDFPIVYVASDPDSGGVPSELVVDEVDPSGPAGKRRLVECLETHAGRPILADGDSAGSSVDDGTTDDRQADGVRDDRIATLLESARDLMGADDADAVADIVVETAERALGYDYVAIYTVDDTGEYVEPVAYSDAPSDFIDDESVPIDGTSFGEVLDEQRPIVLGVEGLRAEGVTAIDSLLMLPIGEHGVLGIGSPDADAFDESDRQVAELLASDATAALDRIVRDRRIQQLHHATQTMLDARTPQEVAERAVEAAESVLGYDLVGLHLREGDGGLLEAVAWTDAIEALCGTPEPIEPGSDGPWVAYERGELQYYEETTPEACAPDSSLESQLHVPIGEHGLLAISSRQPAAFDETDRQLARLLATNTERTLDRVERTHDLRVYETVFETVGDMVYVLDEDGFFVDCTPALADRLGFDRSELLGRHIGEVVDEESFAEGTRYVEELVEAGSSETRTMRVDVTDADGEEVPVEVDISVLPGDEYRGIVGSVRDISDLLAVRERLDSQQDRFEYLFQNIPDPVVEVDFDRDATTVSVNPAFEEVFGVDASDLQDRSLNEMIVPEDRLAEARKLDRKARAGEITTAEIERETRYGRREFLFRGVPYTSSGGTTRGFGIYTDITEQRERERHLDVLQRVLRHNVRNDVNVLLGGVDQLRRSDVDEAVLEGLEETARDLLEMSQKAKRISRVLAAERGQVGRIDLAALTTGVVESYHEEAVEATVDIDAPDQCPVLGSRAVERAIDELVGNAIEHAGDDPTVDVVVGADDGRAAVTVSDDGPGIPEEERRVLQHGDITPLQHGSGLGLWLVKHATAACGGTVRFDHEHEGASVTLSFRRPEGEP